MKYRLVGYTNYCEHEFCFVAPVYIKEHNYYLSVPNDNGLIIEKFIYFNSESYWEKLADVNFETAIGEEAWYIFVYNGCPIGGTKPFVLQELYKIKRQKRLPFLTKYEINFFWGDTNAILKDIRDFIDNHPFKDILKVDNFLLPPIVQLDFTAFADSINMYAKLLEYRNSALEIDTLFKVSDSKVCFLNFRINIGEIKGKFEQIIDKHNLAEYKDLIVHCYIQCNLNDAKLKLHPEFKFRILAPVKRFEELSQSYRVDALQENTQSIYQIKKNAGVISFEITREMDMGNVTSRVDFTIEEDSNFQKNISKIKENA